MKDYTGGLTKYLLCAELTQEEKDVFRKGTDYIETVISDGSKIFFVSVKAYNEYCAEMYADAQINIQKDTYIEWL